MKLRLTLIVGFISLAQMKTLCRFHENAMPIFNCFPPRTQSGYLQAEKEGEGRRR